MTEQIEEVAELDELLLDTTTGTTYDVVKAYGINVRIGSLSSADMLEWIDANDDKEKKKFAGLNLLVKSLVNKKGTRIPEDEREAAIEKFKKKDSRENGKVIAAILILNGLRKKAAEILKNVSSEATTDASPTASPDTSVA